MINYIKTEDGRTFELKLETIQGVNIITLDGEIWVTTISGDKALVLYNLMLDHLTEYKTFN